MSAVSNGTRIVLDVNLEVQNADFARQIQNIVNNLNQNTVVEKEA